MNNKLEKEKCIIALKEFHALINDYFEGNYSNKKEIKSKINILLPLAQNLVIKSNSMKMMSMAPPPAIGGVIIENFNPFDMIFTDFWGQSIIPDISDIVEQSIGKYENNLVDFNKNSKKENDIEYTKEITFKWLYEKVPLKIWVTFFGLLITSFMLGYQYHKNFNTINIQETKIKE